MSMRGSCASFYAIMATGTLLGLTLPAVADSTASAVQRYLAARHAGFGLALAPEADVFDAQFLIVPLPPPANAALRVTGCRWDALRRQVEFRLVCSTVGACRPFVATLRLPDGRVPWQLRGLSPPAAAEGLSPENRRGRGVAPSVPPLVRAGEHVRLVVSGPGIRMKIPVVCLEPGVLGQIIRARSVEDPKVFHAQVLEGGLLATVF